MSSCEKLIAEFVQVANLGESIEKAVIIKNVSRSINDLNKRNIHKKFEQTT